MYANLVNYTLKKQSKYAVIFILTNMSKYVFYVVIVFMRKYFYPRRDLSPGPRPQSKSDDLDRSAIGPVTTLMFLCLVI